MENLRVTLELKRGDQFISIGFDTPVSTESPEDFLAEVSAFLDFQLEDYLAIQDDRLKRIYGNDSRAPNRRLPMKTTQSR